MVHFQVAGDAFSLIMVIFLIFSLDAGISSSEDRLHKEDVIFFFATFGEMSGPSWQPIPTFSRKVMGMSYVS